MTDRETIPAMPVHPAYQKDGKLWRFQTFAAQREGAGMWACVLRVFEQPPAPLPGLPRSVDVDAQEFWCGEFATEGEAQAHLRGPFREITNDLLRKFNAKFGGQVVAAEFGGERT